MSDRKSVVRVTILGEQYTIRSEASPEHTRAVARHVDQAIKAVVNTGTVVETHKAAILAALQITNELFRERESGEALGRKLQELGDEVRRWLPPTKRGEAIRTPNAEDPDGGGP